MRKQFIIGSIFILILLLSINYLWPIYGILFFIYVPVVLLGVYDMFQTKHTILRNFPVIGHFRYLLENIRPEIQQYFVEHYEDGRPFTREERSIIYQRSKHELDTIPFGTQKKVYEVGYEWVTHSIKPINDHLAIPRIKIGNEQCSRPYESSLLNISAMSFGSLSYRAILALNKGAKIGSFAHNTGEGGISPYHLKNGGDLIWQIGTGYFGARTKDGKFCEKDFEVKANLDQVKMIEIKISQGAKPGHGGILPARKVTKEISEIRNVEMGKDVLSPPCHSAFSTPIELLNFVALLRKLSHGKPIGIKLCIGKKSEFLSIVKAMLKTKIYPDFITVDGGEGGTGAAPMEFTNSIGMPLNEGLNFVNNALVGANLRRHIKIIASGKIFSGFSLATKIALGADLCNSARGMMFALGCIQALRCNSNDCPTGIATQNMDLIKGLDIEDKAKRVEGFHKGTIEAFLEVLGAAGISKVKEFHGGYISRRVTSTLVKYYNEIYSEVEEGCLLGDNIPMQYKLAWNEADENNF